MAVLVQSEDIDDGEPWEGTWTLSQSFRGNYSLDYIYYDQADLKVPWIWNYTDKLFMAYSDEASGVGIVWHTVTVDFAGNDLNDLTTTSAVATYIKNAVITALDTEASHWVIDCVYNSSDLIYYLSFQFNHSDHTRKGAISLNWSDPISTSAGVFDKKDDEDTGGEISYNTTVIFNLPAAHVMEWYPKYILMTIDEAATRIIGSCSNTNGTFIISTDSIPFTGQHAMFNNFTSELNISLYRTNISIATVPLGADWSIILRPV